VLHTNTKTGQSTKRGCESITLGCPSHGAGSKRQRRRPERRRSLQTAVAKAKWECRMTSSTESLTYLFTNTLSEAASGPIYDRYAVPGPGRVLFQGALADGGLIKTT
jgi:hypothetical protein